MGRQGEDDTLVVSPPLVQLAISSGKLAKVWAADHTRAYAAACDARTETRNADEPAFATNLSQDVEEDPSAIIALFEGQNTDKSLIYIGKLETPDGHRP